MRWFELERLNDLNRLVVDSFRVVKADARAREIKRGFVRLNSSLEDRNDYLSIALDLHPLKVEKGTIAPIAPLVGKCDEANNRKTSLGHDEEAIVGVVEDCARRCLVIAPLVLHPLTIGLQ